MQHKTDICSKPTLSVRSGCRAGVGMLGQKAICESNCILQRDMRSLECFLQGWPTDGTCDQSQARLDRCLSNCK